MQAKDPIVIIEELIAKRKNLVQQLKHGNSALNRSTMASQELYVGGGNNYHIMSRTNRARITVIMRDELRMIHGEMTMVNNKLKKMKEIAIGDD